MEPRFPTLFVSCVEPSHSPSVDDEFADLDVVVLRYGNGNLPERVLEREEEVAQLQSAAAAAVDAGMAPPPKPARPSTDLFVAYHARRGSDALLQRVLRAVLPLQIPFMITAAHGHFDADVLRPMASDHDAALDINPHWQWVRHPEPTPSSSADASPTACAPEAAPAQSPRCDASLTISPQPAAAAAASAHAFPDSSVPRVTVAPLRLEHVELVTRHWPYSSATTPRVLQFLIGSGGFVHRAVYVDGEPVCWALGQSYGGIGMLHTMAEHRGRGYARLCVDAIYRQLAASGDCAFCFVGSQNFASQKVFKSLGFQPSHQADWVVWRPAVYGPPAAH